MMRMQPSCVIGHDAQPESMLVDSHARATV